MKHVLGVLLVGVSCSCAAPTDEQATQPSGAATPPIYRIEELTWPQIDALDRARTLFVPARRDARATWPAFARGSRHACGGSEADAVAQRVSRASPEWNVVMMPAIAYGHSGANQLGDLPIHPGTYALRQSTFRSLLADIGSQLAQNGFRWIFVLNGHGAPSHGIATDEACDFVSERFGVTMLDVTALFRADPQIQARGAELNGLFFSAEQLASFGLDVHAGVGETAGMLAVRPDLVRREYRRLPSQAGASLEELRAVATSPGWQGYLSSPALATPEYGTAVEEWWIEEISELIRQAIRGDDMSSRPGAPDTLPLPIAPVIERALANEAAFATELEAWLAQRRR